MKKIGIVTYYSIFNYGSVLQAYAMINTVESLGYRAELLDYSNMNKTHNLITRLLDHNSSGSLRNCAGVVPSNNGKEF